MKHPITDEMLIDHVAVLAKTGAGKSYGWKSVVERLAKQGKRICIVDPKNAWWGIKSSGDGKSGGFPFTIFGGPHADMPLLATHGKVLGETIATTDMMSIICTKGMPEGERIRFLTDFFQTLDMRNQTPIYLILDEAHMMAPQKPLGEMQRLTHWTSELVSGGRGMGFRVTLLSQRPARLNKDVLTQCETLVAMRMTGPQDRNAVWSWIEDQGDRDKGKEIVASLPKLKTGHGWLWSPKLDILEAIVFPKISTYDSSKTQKDGNADKRAKLAPVDLAKLKAMMGAAAAEIEANDPAALKRQIAELQKSLKEVAKAKGVPAANVTMVAGYTKEQVEGQRVQAWETGYAAGFNDARGSVSGTLFDLSRNLKMTIDKSFAEACPASAMRVTVKPGESTAPKAMSDASATRIAKDLAPQIPKIERALGVSSRPTGSAPARIKGAIKWWMDRGHDSPTRVQVAFLARYSPRSSGYEKQLSTLSSAGEITFPSPGRVTLVDPQTVEASGSDNKIEAVQAVIDPRMWRVLEPLVHRDRALSRSDLAELCGYSDKSSGYEKTLSQMRGLDVIEFPSPGYVKAASWLL